MPVSLHAALVPSWLQTIGAAAGLVDKAEAFCAERGVAPAAIIGARLAEDMLPFAYQVKSVRVHSAGAIDGVRAGRFSPDMSELPTSFDGLRAELDTARARIAAVSADEMEGFIGRDVAFVFGDFRIDFLAEDFLLSFSQPNFYFHATAAYAILRGQGVALGKRDFLGAVRKKA